MSESCAPHPYVTASCELRKPHHPICTGKGPDGYVDWVNLGYVPSESKTKAQAAQKLAKLAGRVPRTTGGRNGAPAPTEGFPAGLAGSEDAANRWDEGQKALVDDAIVIVAAKRAGETFTSDAVWAQLNNAVPVTKGLTARLIAAEREGTIENTGETTISERGGEHDHGQRLTLWRSLA